MQLYVKTLQTSCGIHYIIYMQKHTKINSTQGDLAMITFPIKDALKELGAIHNPEYAINGQGRIRMVSGNFSSHTLSDNIIPDVKWTDFEQEEIYTETHEQALAIRTAIWKQYKSLLDSLIDNSCYPSPRG